MNASHPASSGPANAESPATERATVLILGAGFAGMGAAIELRKQGIRDILVLERAAEVGGTWRDNRYPGCACDVPSHLYSYSFELNPDWSHHYAGREEIQSYILRVREKYGLTPLLRLGAEAVSARFDEAAGEWTVETSDGRRFVARFLVSGLGPLRIPRFPELPGQERFKGPTMHSAQWDDSVELAGKRVGVVGSGASAIQIVPSIAEEVGELHVFQRTPPWIAPRFDPAYPAWLKDVFRTVPAVMALLRLLIYLRQEVYFYVGFRGPGLLRKLVRRVFVRHIVREMGGEAAAQDVLPSYTVGCKRVISSSDWFPALRRPDVHLHPQAVAEVTETGVVLANGETVELDVIIWCTGFVVDQPLGSTQVRGRKGVSLKEVWGLRPKAHLGLTVPDFPNFFLLLGPNSGLGHNSVLVMIEAQLNYVRRAIAHTMARGERAWVAPTQATLDAFLAEVDRAHEGRVWQSGCTSWYLNSRGENFSIWPYTTVAYILRTLRFDAENYEAGGES